ncbi:MAG: hypothetical protein O8C67_08640 [Candidatus Methanoperedens sp.]|nr:hypothetical protein [Candidatus Methanoperedens sp.]
MKNKTVWLGIIAFIYSIPIIFGFYYIDNYAVNIPFNDQWGTIVPWTTSWYEGSFDFNQLFILQNDSRGYVTGVFMLLVSILTALNIKTMFYVGYMIYIICFILLLYFIRIDMKLDHRSLILLLPLSFYAFNPYYLIRYIDNLGALSGPPQILLVLIAFYLIYKSKDSNLYYIGSIVMGVVCSFSGVIGLSIWFAGLVQLILQKMHRKWQKVAIWIISAAATFYVYFVILDFKKEGPHSTDAYSSFFVTALHYPIQKFLTFMGVIGAEVIHDMQIALFFGLIIFFSAIALVYVNRHYLELDRLSKWYGILTFGTLTSLELALARSGSGEYFGSPDTIYFIPAPRHSLVIFLPIMCIYILALIYSKKSIIDKSAADRNLHNSQAFFIERKELNLFLLGIIFTLLVSSVMLHALPGLEIGEEYHNTQIINQYILQNYLIAPDEKLKALYPAAYNSSIQNHIPETVRTEAAKLEKYKLNIFAESDINKIPDWNSLTLARGGMMAIDVVANKTYSNENEIININKKMNQSIELTGWAADNLSNDGNVKTYLVLNDENEKIVLPTMKIIRPDVADYFKVESYKDSGWLAMTQTSKFKEQCYNISVRILRSNGKEYYEINGDKELCFS